MTSNWRLFADLPGFCSLAGMTFTPEGKLRVAGFHTSTILEFESDGSWKVVLDSSHGIHLPGANNNITYDKSGNFFVSQGITADSKIMKFPGGQAPGSVFANLATGMSGTGPIAAAPDGSIYYHPPSYPGPNEYGAILRYAPDGTVSLLERARVFIGTQDGNPNTKQLISMQFFGTDKGIALSDDEKSIYSILGGVLSVNLATGTSQVLGTLPQEPLIGGWGKGIAVYVPEPSCLWFVILCPLLRRVR